MSALRYVAPEFRARRYFDAVNGRRGYCRLCRGSIVVPKGYVKSAALRNWKRIPTRHRAGDALRSEGLEFRLYTRATWHPWCWSYASVLMNPDPSSISKRQGERWYSCASCQFPIKWAQGTGGRWSATPCPWVSRAAFVAGLSPQDLAKMEGGGEVDHIVPLWAGGIHQLSNLQVLCVPCHREKTSREALVRAQAKRLASGEPVQGSLSLSEATQ